MSDAAELLEDLQDARAELARYRRMLAVLGTGTGVGLVTFLAGAPMIISSLPDGAVAIVMVAGGIVAVVCMICLICAVVSANGTDIDYGSGRSHSRHPAVKVRAAERRYNRALLRPGE